mmetsp:Transcript_70453/g.187330  ORF Transcript_70453/g.187330 Transcript_70453/m.187330 type:complete len:248 (+) Transcript_70453:145-888(+)
MTHGSAIAPLLSRLGDLLHERPRRERVAKVDAAQVTQCLALLARRRRGARGGVDGAALPREGHIGARKERVARDDGLLVERARRRRRGGAAAHPREAQHVGRRRAVRGVAHEEGRDELRGAGRHAAPALGEERGRERRRVLARAVREVGTERDICRDADCPHVGGERSCLLRRSVEGTADRAAPGDGGLAFGEDDREPEIRQLDAARVARAAEDVLGLDVSVHYPPVMEPPHGLHQLRHDGEHLALG